MTTAIDAARVPARGVAATTLPQLGGLYAIWLREVKRASATRASCSAG